MAWDYGLHMEVKGSTLWSHTRAIGDLPGPRAYKDYSGPKNLEHPPFKNEEKSLVLD